MANTSTVTRLELAGRFPDEDAATRWFESVFWPDGVKWCPHCGGDNPWPETREQRCWVHRLARVLDKLPKRLQAKAERALHEIMYAECREDAEAEIERFASEYGPRYPKAVESLRRDEDSLLSFFDFPAEHWQHLRTSNAIESTFATVGLRQRVTKGAGSRTKALLMAFKLLDMAQKRWRRVTAPHLVAPVRKGVPFTNGTQVRNAA